MITKRSQKSSNSVENLKQGSFTAVKGIDNTAPALSKDTVLHSKNLEVDFDGGLILRKPIVCVNELPTRGSLFDTVFTTYIFDNTHILIIQKSKVDGSYVFRIFQDENKRNVRLGWRSWQDYTLYQKILEPSASGFIESPDLDFNNVSVTNTATSSVLTGVLVNIASSTFRRADETYPDNVSTDLYYSKLYDVSNSVNTLYKARTLILTKSTSDIVDFDLTIVTPDINTLQTTEILTLDTNLDLDNPYSIRDVYNTSAPAIKNIIAYVPTRTVNGHTELSFETVRASSDVSKLNISRYNSSYSPVGTLDLELIRSGKVRFKAVSQDGAVCIKYVFPNSVVNTSICGFESTLAANIWIRNPEGASACVRFGESSSEGGHPEKGTRVTLQTSTSASGSYDSWEWYRSITDKYLWYVDAEMSKPYVNKGTVDRLNNAPARVYAWILNTLFSGEQAFKIPYDIWHTEYDYFISLGLYGDIEVIRHPDYGNSSAVEPYTTLILFHENSISYPIKDSAGVYKRIEEYTNSTVGGSWLIWDGDL